MAFWAVMGFVLAIIAMSSLSNVKYLKRRVKILEKRSRGNVTMSELLKKVVGQECTIIIDNELFSEKFMILEIDEEWAKLGKTTKKGKVEIRLVRIENIKEIRPL